MSCGPKITKLFPDVDGKNIFLIRWGHTIHDFKHHGGFLPVSLLFKTGPAEFTQ